MKRTYAIRAAACGLCLAPAALAQSGGPYSIVSSTIDGGGSMWSSGGSFSLGGTIGQADAGRHNGAGYTLLGGFWTEQPSLDCYANCDGSTVNPVLNVADFSCFLSKFAAGDTYANCDGSTSQPTLNVADFTCFLTKFAAGCS
jgi:hypothetical protein